MNGRECIEAAFEGGCSDRFGAVICYPGIFYRDHIHAFNRTPWWYGQSPDLGQQLIKARELTVVTGLDWYGCHEVHDRHRRSQLHIRLEGERVLLFDEDTGEQQELTPPQPGGTTSPPPTLDRLPETEKELDALFLADESPAATSPNRDGSMDWVESVATNMVETYPIAHVSSPLWSTYGKWGYEGLMLMAASHPELLFRAGRHRLVQCLPRLARLASAGCRAIWIEECLIDQINPQQYAAINLPILQDLCAAIRASGMRSIYYYCGNPWNRLDHILATGADALSFEESKKGFDIDIEDVVRAVDGRAVVLGNLDAYGVLEQGGDEALAHEVGRQLHAGRRNRGRFIMSTGSPVTPDTPVERVRRYCDLVHAGAAYRCPQTEAALMA